MEIAFFLGKKSTLVRKLKFGYVGFLFKIWTITLKLLLKGFFIIRTKCVSSVTFQENMKDWMHSIQAKNHIRFWHEWLRNLNFWILKLMVKHTMVIGLPKVIPLDEVWEGCMLGEHHHDALFPLMKYEKGVFLESITKILLK